MSEQKSNYSTENTNLVNRFCQLYFEYTGELLHQNIETKKDICISILKKISLHLHRLNTNHNDKITRSIAIWNSIPSNTTHIKKAPELNRIIDEIKDKMDMAKIFLAISAISGTLGKCIEDNIFEIKELEIFFKNKNATPPFYRKKYALLVKFI